MNCLVCETDFKQKNSYREKLCSIDCKIIRRRQIGKKFRDKHLKTPSPRSCHLCHKNFQPRTRHDARYCTPKCYMRSSQIKELYGLNTSQYKELLSSQGYKCAGCLLPFNDATPYVDHDHDTGAVRGLLHGKCNSVLGFCNDNPEILKALAHYLKGTL